MLCALGSAGAFALMARPGHVPHGALWGGLALCAALLGLFLAFGILRPELAGEECRSWRESAWGRMPGEARWAAPGWALLAALLTLAISCGLWPDQLSLAVVLSCVYFLPAAMRRPGLLLMVVVGLLYLPLLGTYGLWDPWETHYGEVAREILARDDWISLWWAQDGWFWSKPVLIFWAEALAWSASGVDFRPDSQFTMAEWVLRLPVCALSMVTVAAVYLSLKKLWSARAGVVSGLVLATTPFFALLSHQAITDMYFVANMTIAMMCLTGAVTTEKDAIVPNICVGRYVVSAQHGVIGLLFMLGLPQVLYLASRNVTWLPDGLSLHPDYFSSGSGLNAGLVPGNPAAVRYSPVFSGPLAQPLALAFYFGVPLAYLLWSLRRERRARALLMVAFYLFCALAFMGKGIPGVALPGLIAALWLIAQRRWDLLLSGQLLVSRGALLVASLGLPWFVAEFMRQGTRFTDRLLIHDHINRLTSGVHGDTGSVQYFIAQLGYGLFPWIALLPLACMLWPAGGGQADEASAKRQRAALSIFGLWLVAAFALFSAMTTKFHHYILPAVPAAALLIGLGFYRLQAPIMAAEVSHRGWLGRGLAWLAPIPAALAAAGAMGDPRGRLPPSVEVGMVSAWVEQQRWSAIAVVVGLFLFWALLILAQRLQPQSPQDRMDVGAGAALLMGAALTVFVARDLAWATGRRPAGQERLIQLFIYKYDRPFPEHFDYHAIFGGFGCVVVLLCVIATARRLRAVALQALLSSAVLYSAFTLYLYIPDLTPHWSQRELVAEYYAERSGPAEPLVAWQMNWKGENFYTGNRVPVFQQLDNKRIKKYIDSHGGQRTFFLLEHKRLDRFKRLLAPRVVDVRSTEYENNKFVLVSARL